MRKDSIRILVIEDDEGDLLFLEEIIKHTEDIRIFLHTARSLKEGIEFLKNDPTDLILLDLNLPDSHGLDTYLELFKLFETIPIVVLTGLQDEDMAFETIKRGAQDYLVKDWISPSMLSRNFICAIERSDIQKN